MQKQKRFHRVQIEKKKKIRKNAKNIKMPPNVPLEKNKQDLQRLLKESSENYLTWNTSLDLTG